jgi:hypothetical protein
MARVVRDDLMCRRANICLQTARHIVIEGEAAVKHHTESFDLSGKSDVSASDTYGCDFKQSSESFVDSKYYSIRLIRVWA